LIRQCTGQGTAFALKGLRKSLFFIEFASSPDIGRPLPSPQRLAFLRRET
jgi:hypothetical protein